MIGGGLPSLALLDGGCAALPSVGHDPTDSRGGRAGAVDGQFDDGGVLLVLHRLDDTQIASVEVGVAKVRTAAIFRRPSKVFEDQVKNGRVAALALPGAAPLQGGIPIVHRGKVVGAIGVSGNTPQEDEDIAKAGASALPDR